MMRNQDDFIFRSGGDHLTLSLEKDSSGYKTSFEIALPV
jgi:hypothetical protein